MTKFAEKWRKFRPYSPVIVGVVAVGLILSNADNEPVSKPDVTAPVTTTAPGPSTNINACVDKAVDNTLESYMPVLVQEVQISGEVNNLAIVSELRRVALNTCARGISSFTMNLHPIDCVTSKNESGQERAVPRIEVFEKRGEDDQLLDVEIISDAVLGPPSSVCTSLKP